MFTHKLSEEDRQKINRITDEVAKFNENIKLLLNLFKNGIIIKPNTGDQNGRSESPERKG